MKSPAKGRAMYRASISSMVISIPIHNPNSEKTLDTKWTRTAILILNSFLRKMAKSPSSCGISCKRQTIDVQNPNLASLLNDEPMAMPSKKLCKPSPTMIIQTDALIRLFCVLSSVSLDKSKVSSNLLDLFKTRLLETLSCFKRFWACFRFFCESKIKKKSTSEIEITKTL